MGTLNPQQLQAVQHLSGPLLVLAGAGSGKTRVITHKISYLIAECGYKANKIFAVTFTNKASREMSARIATTLGKKARGLNVSTFHTLGLNFIRHEYKELGLKANISIYDTEDVTTLLKDLSASDHPNIQQISHWKNANILPAQALQLADDEELFATAQLYLQYQSILRSYNAVDFDDLILLPLQLLQENSDIKEKWQNKVQYLLVDEYQDTNTTQYELIKHLTGVKGALTVVGDDHQAIYAWRGANQENINYLQEDYPTLKVITLEQNYRSTGTILQAANALISHNPHKFSKNLWSTLGMGDQIRIIGAPNEVEEAQRIAAEIHQHKFVNQTKFSDYAVLYRSNHQARLFEQALRELQIPYQISGGTSFFARTEVKDILAYLKLLVNPDDDMAFLRIANVPKREIGPTTIERLAQYSQMREVSLLCASNEIGLEQTLANKYIIKLREFNTWLAKIAEMVEREDSIDVIRKMVEDIDYETWLLDSTASSTFAEKRWHNVQELLAWLEKLMKNDLSLAEALNKMILIDMLNRQEEEKDRDRVSLTTMHAAKGLEFPHVFIVGMEENILPHHNSVTDEAIEEERRLAYVGITRAQFSLSLSYCTKRKRYKELFDCEPSRFLHELPSELVIWEGQQEKSPEQRQQHGKGQLSILKAMLQKDPI